MVKLEVDPEMVIVPGVWELRVPPERIPPILEPEELSALRVAFEGRPVWLVNNRESPVQSREKGR